MYHVLTVKLSDHFTRIVIGCAEVAERMYLLGTLSGGARIDSSTSEVPPIRTEAEKDEARQLIEEWLYKATRI